MRYVKIFLLSLVILILFDVSLDNSPVNIKPHHRVRDYTGGPEISTVTEHHSHHGSIDYRL